MFRSMTLALVVAVTAQAAMADYCDNGCDSRQTYTELESIYDRLPNELPVTMVGNWQHDIQSSSFTDLTVRNSAPTDYSTYHIKNPSELNRNDVLLLALGKPDFAHEKQHMEIFWPSKFGIKRQQFYRLENSPDNILRWTDVMSYNIQCRLMSDKKMLCRWSYERDYIADVYTSANKPPKKERVHDRTTHYSGFSRTTLSPTLPDAPTLPAPTPAPTPASEPTAWECTVDHPVVGFYSARATLKNDAKTAALNKCVAGLRLRGMNSGICHLYGATCEAVR